MVTIKQFIIRNEDCRKTIKHMKQKEIKVDCVITSPPYNTSRKVRTETEIKERKSKYKMYDDAKPFDEYKQFIVQVINKMDDIIKDNGTIIMNISYASSIEIGMIGSRLIELLYDIISKTRFDVADIITWKKKSALPNNRSSNKCTRICEYVFVLCRKEEYKTFVSNKQITKQIEEKGLIYYSNMFNFIEAANNDGKNPYNNATYSTDLVKQILDMYVVDDATVYDPFAGTCTTAVACKKEKRNIKCICSEIDKEQCEYGKERLKHG